MDLSCKLRANDYVTTFYHHLNKDVANKRTIEDLLRFSQTFSQTQT